MSGDVSAKELAKAMFAAREEAFRRLYPDSTVEPWSSLSPNDRSVWNVAAEVLTDDYLTAALDAVKAEAGRAALREAAADVPMFEFMLVMDIAAEVAPGQIGAWLRARADQIGGAS